MPSGFKRYVLGWYYRSDGVPALTDQERQELAAILEEVSATRRADGPGIGFKPLLQGFQLRDLVRMTFEG